MPRTRTDARRDYRHFPREYTDLLVAFEREGRAVLTFSEQREAAASRRQLYQFKMLAQASLDRDPEDAQARWLVDVFNTVTIRIDREQAPEAGDDTVDAVRRRDASQSLRWRLVLDTNALVRAMRSGALAASAASGGNSTAVVPQHLPLEATRLQVSKPGHTPAPTRSLVLGCRHPAACRSTIHGAPAFCECSDEASASASPTKEQSP